MLVVFILKIKSLNKPTDKQFACIQKSTYLDWNVISNNYTIIPTITFYGNNKCIEITFEWLKIMYINIWDIITYEEEEAMSDAKRNIFKNNNNESSSV